MECRTKDGRQCVLPFKFEGETYFKCPVDPIEPSETWCSTRVGRDGTHINGVGNYGFCSKECPTAETTVKGQRSFLAALLVKILTV